MKLLVDIRNEVGNRRCENLTRLFCRKIFGALLQEPEFRYLKKRREVGLSVILAADAKSHRLNRRYRGVNRATNVISFPLFPDAKTVKGNKLSVLDLGDIVVAPRVVRREAERAGATFYSQFFWVMLHGILHVLGLDHEGSARGRVRMEFLERRLRKRILGGSGLV